MSPIKLSPIKLFFYIKRNQSTECNVSSCHQRTLVEIYALRRQSELYCYYRVSLLSLFLAAFEFVPHCRWKENQFNLQRTRCRLTRKVITPTRAVIYLKKKKKKRRRTQWKCENHTNDHLCLHYLVDTIVFKEFKKIITIYTYI